jgi:hypothetical protein
MKNIIRYPDNDLDFHKNIVSQSINKGDIKDNLISNEHIITSRYKEYNAKFDICALASLNPYGFDGEDKENLLKLYSSQRKPIIDLKTKLTTNEFNQRNNTCPNCTIETVASLDHYIPKDEFPELSVNPSNLVPCCSTCNSKKKEKWKDEQALLFLNLYSDLIPSTQYLFVKIESEINFKFELKNISGIDEDLFKVIESHYCKLDLLQRFKDNSDEEISEFSLFVSSIQEIMNDKEEIKEFIENHYLKKEAKDGINNWKIVLIRAMINSDVYFK